MDLDDDTLAALVTLHKGLLRQGPGDPALAHRILDTLPPLPKTPRIADLGCGAGSGALMLAERYRTLVTAVDLMPPFLETLKEQARKCGLEAFIHPVEADMGKLDWPAESLDLLWSEGAAYLLTFRGALHKWRRLLAPGGLAVISEITWLTDTPPDSLVDYWHQAYPAMATEAQNREHARSAGYETLATYPLPSAAWWSSYYQPLQQQMEHLAPTADPTLQAVIAETRAEMQLFENHADEYGYVFYILRV